MNVIVADDSDFMRAILRQQLKVTGHTVLAEARSGLELVELSGRIPSDLIITDEDMDPMNGLDAAIHILAQDPGRKILCSTQYNVASWIQEMKSIGICGYLYKNSGPENLKRAIEMAMLGEFYVDDVILKQVLQDLKTLLKQKLPGARHTLSREIEEIVNSSEDFRDINGFTPDHRELLILSATAQGKPVKQIAGLLNTTERNISKIKEKMRARAGVSSNAELIRMSMDLCWI